MFDSRTCTQEVPSVLVSQYKANLGSAGHPKISSSQNDRMSLKQKTVSILSITYTAYMFVHHFKQ